MEIDGIDYRLASVATEFQFEAAPFTGPTTTPAPTVPENVLDKQTVIIVTLAVIVVVLVIIIGVYTTEN